MGPGMSSVGCSGCVDMAGDEDVVVVWRVRREDAVVVFVLVVVEGEEVE